MSSRQQSLYEGLLDIAIRVRDGGYGQDFNIDIDAVDNDLDELLDSVEAIHDGENQDGS